MSARGNWSGTYGFIIAAIGSAVGLGNIWRFPYLAGMNGGGAFVLLYLVMAVFVGVSLLVAEQALGRYAATSPYGAFHSIHSKFGFVGTIAILANFLILSFYSMIGGWVIYYLFGSVIAPHTLTAEGFQTFSTSTVLPLLSQFAFMALTGFFVWRGISKGIEWGNRIMMPLLFLMLGLIVIRSLTLPGAMEGVRFFFRADFSKINGSTVISALGQVFFSMSVGFGIMLTYASYLGKDTPLSRSSWLIAMSNSLVAVLAGLAILPAVFSFKMEPEQGPGLLFVVIPEIFRQMSGGYFFGILFFLLVFFAALTSSISILEVPVSYLVDERKLSRKKSVIVASLIISVLGVFCTLSMGSTLGWFKVYEMGIFDLLDFVSNNMLLPVGGLMLCIVIGYVWKPEKVLKEITQDGKHPFLGKEIWPFLIKYLVPLAIVVILISGSGIPKIARSFFE